MPGQQRARKASGMVALIGILYCAGPAVGMDPPPPDRRQAPPDLRTIAATHYDLMIAGGTPGGVAMAVRAAREGLTVLLTNHTQHLGGMLANGLGVWDTLYAGSRNPLYDELAVRIEEIHRDTYGPDSPQYRSAKRTQNNRGYFEPRLAERAVDQLVGAERNITVLKGYYPESVERDGALLQSVALREMDGDRVVTVRAKVFADATYEGDLFAAAKVPYRVGRESRDEYSEPHAGEIYTSLQAGKFPRDAVEGRLNIRPYRLTIKEVFPQSTGKGDMAIQAFNFRVCITGDPANRRLPEKPAHYDRTQFLDYKRGMASGAFVGKRSWNGPLIPGGNHDYPEADWKTRQEITRRHREYALGVMYFLQNDESIPEAQRQAYRQVGLARDEFVDNDNMPYEMYVREARRLTGRYVFTQHDGMAAPGLGRAPIHPDSIAITEWFLDSHSCTKRQVPGSEYEGKVILAEETRPGQVAYRCLLPRGVDNLLVPVCLSSTHIGWGTIRLEPTMMNVGESAGCAAALAVRSGKTPATIDTDELLRTVAEKRVMISFFNDVDVAAKVRWVPAVQYLGTKGFFPTYDAHPDRPLTAAVARQWARMAGLLAAGRLDPMAEVRALYKLPPTEGEPVTVAEFAAFLQRELASSIQSDEAVRAAVKALGLTPDARISRAEACELVCKVCR